MQLLHGDPSKQPPNGGCGENQWKLEYEPIVMAALPNTGGALCESSVIPFPVRRRKVWECSAVTLPKKANARLGRKVNFAPGKILSGGKSPQKCIYSVPAQETAKHRAMFGWPPVSDFAAVTKARRETR